MKFLHMGKLIINLVNDFNSTINALALSIGQG